MLNLGFQKERMGGVSLSRRLDLRPLFKVPEPGWRKRVGRPASLRSPPAWPPPLTGLETDLGSAAWRLGTTQDLTESPASPADPAEAATDGLGAAVARQVVTRFGVGRWCALARSAQGASPIRHAAQDDADASPFGQLDWTPPLHFEPERKEPDAQMKALRIEPL